MSDVEPGAQGDEVPVAPTALPAPPGPLSVSAVARRLGVAPATLRSWARRYGLGPSEHTAGRHRRYSHEDVRRLEIARQQILAGVPPAAAARAALDADLCGPATAVAPAAAWPLPDQEGALPRVAPSGGRVLAVPAGGARTRGLSRAVMALDAATATAAIRADLAEHGVVRSWHGLLCPVLESIGERWAATGEGVEVEHLLSECAAVALREVVLAVRPVTPQRPVLLSGAPGDQHALPLYALSAALAELGVEARVLGPALPVRALIDAVRRTGPALLLVWSQTRETADPKVFEAVPVTRPPAVLVAGGSGWDDVTLPPRTTRAVDLPHACELVGSALGREISVDPAS